MTKSPCATFFCGSQRDDRPSTAGCYRSAVVECLGRFGWPAEHPANTARREVFVKGSIRRRFLVWPLGRQYIYGTSGVLRALETVR